MSWDPWKNNGCHDTWVIVDAEELLKRVEKPSQLLPMMIVFHTKCARSTTSIRGAQTLGG